MHKRNRSILMRVLSVVIAAGISISGLPAGAMAAETTAEIETETASVTEAEAEEASEQQTETAQESEETAEEASAEETTEDATEETTEAATDADQETESGQEIEADQETESGQETEDGQNPESGQETGDNTIPSLQGENDISEEGEVLAKDAEVPDGWYYEGNDTYYYIDGEPVVETVINVNGSYYGFGYDGRLIKNEEFGFFSFEFQHQQYYRAKANGELYVNTWYQNEYGEWYYYGEGGVAAHDEVKEINGVLYAFLGFCLHPGGPFVYGDDVYLVDKNGVARLKATINGWYWGIKRLNSDDAGWQYYVDGEPIQNQIARIDGALYCFDSDGYMVNSLWDYYFYDENGTEVHCHARDNGVLYENEWFDFYGTWYYYGENGIGAEGVLTIGGTRYAFTHGRMLTNQVYTDNTGTYSINGSGVATLKEWTEGWNNMGGKWYYYENGHAVSDEIKKIGGSYYGFDKNGVMYQSQLIDIFNESTMELLESYRAKASGELYVNSWYQDEWGQWFYYGEDARGLDGPHKVGGTWYFFGKGHMSRNRIEPSEDGLYQVDGNGVATKLNRSDGWHQISGNWYYFRNGTAVYDEVIKDGSKYYLLNVDGIMLKSSGYWLYDKNSGELIGRYCAKSDGSLYVNEWCESRMSTGADSWTVWYYFGDGGLGPNGLYIVNNVPYVFFYGYMTINDTYYDKTGVYDIRENGVAVKIGPEYITDFTNYTWSESDGSWYCFENGEPVKNKIILYGSCCYGFDSSGRMFDDEAFILYDSETGKDVYYRAKPGGELYSSTYFEDSDGVKYYYDFGPKGAEGLVRIDGKEYLFEHARLLVNELRDYNGSLYLTNGEGAAYKIQDGWNSIDGYRYYFDDNVMYTGLQTIGNSQYYFRESGAMCTGWVKIDDAHYFFKGNGAMYTGWLSSGGKWYYLDKTTGEMLTGLQTIDGQTYYMDSTGAMATGWQNIEEKWYFFNSSGTMATGWFSSGGKWYYLDKTTGEMLTGLQTIGGQTYYLGSGAMATGWQKINEKWYFFNSSGAMVTGWFSSGGKWYYLDKTTGEMLTGLQTIDDQTYYLGSGAMATGWQSIEGAWYYFRSSGTMVTGWLKLGNIWYYFTSSGEMVTGELTINGKLYRFNASGACLNP